MARALPQRLHRFRGSMGQRFLGVGEGCGDTGEPLTPRVRQLLEVLRAVQSAVGDQGRWAIGGRPLGHVRRDDVPEVTRGAGMATERLHQQRDAGLMCHDQVPHDVIAVGPMVTAVAAGEVKDTRLRLLGTIVAALDVETRAVQMCKGRRASQAFGGGDRHQAVECCHARVVERIRRALVYHHGEAGLQCQAP
jgi:hypothetical protein